jgi:hypothetical protein
MPMGTGSYGGHQAAVEAGGTRELAVPIVSNHSIPDDISSIHHFHLRVNDVAAKEALMGSIIRT